MRVLLLANTLPPRDVSGVGEQVLQLAAGLRSAGHEVEVLGRGGAGAAGPKSLFPLTAVPAVWRALRRFRPHVLQVHESDGGLAALAALAMRSWLRPSPLLVALLQVSYREERRAVRPIVADGRVLGRPGAVERRFRWGKAPLQIVLGWLTARVADRVLAPSAVTAEEIRRDYHVRDVRVVPNAMGRGAERGAEAAFPPGYLLFVGRLRIRKGVEVLLEAVRRLADTGEAGGAGDIDGIGHPPPRLLIAGDGEHREALERRTAELGLGGSVTFLGRRDGGEVRALLAGAAALVVPSLYEGMPLVILEAMEEGVPVVASRVSGIPEVVEDGRSGWLVPPEEPALLAGALRQLLADPAEGLRRGQAGRRILDERFRPAAAAAAWQAAIGPALEAESPS